MVGEVGEPSSLFFSRLPLGLGIPVALILISYLSACPSLESISGNPPHLWRMVE